MTKILVVDDRPENIELLEAILESADYEVTSAVDGEHGLRRAESVLPDLIISDILMPNVDGFQFCHMVRKNPALTDIPFLFLTGAYVSADDEKFAFELGANRFIRRPFQADELLETVRDVLESNPNTSLKMPADLDEEAYVKQHMGRLTQTLEDKVVELEQVTEENTKLLHDAQSQEAKLQQSLDELQATQAYLVQSERLSAVGQLVAGVAHELNNPLAIILGYSQLILRMPEASTRMTECLKKLEDAAQRCQNIVHHLTIFAQKNKVEKKPLNINDVVRSVVDIRKDQFDVDGISIEITLDPRLLVVYADYQQLQQVFLSLVNNAQEALIGQTESERLIELKTRLVEQRVFIDFIDNGVGLKEELLPNLFEPFFTTKDFGQGIGLGLSVCYGIIKGHDGDITAAGNQSGGATFSIELPLHRVGKEEPPQAGRPKDTTDQGSVKQRILVIDDEAGILDILSSSLEQAGYSVDTAQRAADGLQALHNEEYDLILMDIRLPDSDGGTLFHKVKAMDPEVADRVIFITGDTVSTETLAFIEETGNIYIAKPFDIESVRQLVARRLASGD